MSRVLINTSNSLLADVLKKQLDGNDFQSFISTNSTNLISDFNRNNVSIVLLEVKRQQSWTLKERMKQLNQLKRNDANCKIVLLVDEINDPELTEQVIQCKKDGIINDFIYPSVSGNYFLGVMKAL